MSKYTKGPWQVTPDKIRVQTAEDAEDFQIAECEDSQFAPPLNQCQANAHLIAAAPELLEACKKADKIAEELVNFGEMTADGRAAMRIANKLHKIVKQAIAKAEGGQKC